MDPARLIHILTVAAWVLPLSSAWAEEPIAEKVVLEGVTGQAIASHLDPRDRPIALALFARGFVGAIGVRYFWRNTATGNYGYFRVSWEFRDGDLLCRDFTEETQTGKRRFVGQGTACLQPDGKWHLR